MQAFEWHLAAHGFPPEGKGDYVIKRVSHDAELCYASKVVSLANGPHFYVPNRREHYFGADLVYAWAEIPPFEEYESERVMCVGRCTECDHYYHNNSFCNPSWCDWWGDETEDDGFCHEFEPRSDDDCEA